MSAVGAEKNALPQSTRGLLIGFDGVDCSGKQTQAKHLAQRLRYMGYVVKEFQTPDYSTPSGQQLKLRLQGKLGDWANTSWTEKMRYFAENRAEHREEVLHALKHGEMVIYDRYVPSSLAFIAIEALGAQADELFRQDVYRAVKREEYEKNNMPEEDVSIFLDVPPRISAALLEKRKQLRQDADEYTDHLGVQERLYNEYDLMMNDAPGRFLRIKCVEGTQLLPIDAVSELIWDGLVEKFPFLLTKPVTTV